MWRAAGCSVRAASALAIAGCMTLQDVRPRGRDFFSRMPNCGEHTLSEISDLIGGWPPDRASSPRAATAAALRLSIDDRQTATEAAGDAIAALYRAGFVISKEGSRQ
jgi:hypothetical protein